MNHLTQEQLSFVTCADNHKNDPQIIEELVIANDNLRADVKKLMEKNEVLIKESEKNTSMIETLQAYNHELHDDQLKLVDKNANLVRINEDLDNFVYTASHDLLGPLNNIEASLVAIQWRKSEEDLDVFLNIINLSVKNFSALIREMSAIAHVESDNTNIELVDLTEIVENIKWSIENKFDATGAKIITDFEVNNIRFSKKNLRSILYNLIVNAIKFKSNEPPVIKIVTRQNGNYTMLMVQDNGIGISPLAIDKIFDAYGRLNNDIEGNGIGLYLAKKIINAAGGQITVKSEVGKGTEFNINFDSSL